MNNESPQQRSVLRTGSRLPMSRSAVVVPRRGDVTERDVVLQPSSTIPAVQPAAVAMPAPTVVVAPVDMPQPVKAVYTPVTTAQSLPPALPVELIAMPTKTIARPVMAKENTFVDTIKPLPKAVRRPSITTYNEASSTPAAASSTSISPQANLFTAQDRADAKSPAPVSSRPIKKSEPVVAKPDTKKKNFLSKLFKR